jgi:hypothetical protein
MTLVSFPWLRREKLLANDTVAIGLVSIQLAHVAVQRVEQTIRALEPLIEASLQLRNDFAQQSFGALALLTDGGINRAFDAII